MSNNNNEIYIYIYLFIKKKKLKIEVCFVLSHPPIKYYWWVKNLFIFSVLGNHLFIL